MQTNPDISPQNIKLGDVVTLKSDPQVRMTVTAAYTNGKVECSWFSDDRLETARLPLQALRCRVDDNA